VKSTLALLKEWEFCKLRLVTVINSERDVQIWTMRGLALAGGAQRAGISKYGNAYQSQISRRNFPGPTLALFQWTSYRMIWRSCEVLEVILDSLSGRVGSWSCSVTYNKQGLHKRLLIIYCTCEFFIALHSSVFDSYETEVRSLI
jgi:hypothetical protein